MNESYIMWKMLADQVTMQERSIAALTKKVARCNKTLGLHTIAISSILYCIFMLDKKIEKNYDDTLAELDSLRARLNDNED